MEKIDWSNLELDKMTISELLSLKQRSYMRYDPPRWHWMYFMMGVFCLFMMFFIGYSYDLPRPSGWEDAPMSWLIYPSPTSFAIQEVVLMSIVIICVYLFVRGLKLSPIRWAEMEKIRKSIDAEFERRDDLLGV